MITGAGEGKKKSSENQKKVPESEKHPTTMAGRIPTYALSCAKARINRSIDAEITGFAISSDIVSRSVDRSMPCPLNGPLARLAQAPVCSISQVNTPDLSDPRK